MKLIQETGAMIAARQQSAAVSMKGRANYVTDIDLAAQEQMRAGLAALFPGYGLFSEEQENHPDFSRPLWVLDPIDGTANFVTDLHMSAISLALWNGSAVTWGAVYNPFTRELFTAERGKGAALNGSPIRGAADAPLEELLVDLGTLPYYKERAAETGRIVTEIIRRASDLRRLGSAALALCFAACGRVGVMAEGLLSPWDYAAGALIAEEAGLTVTDWQGAPLTLTHRCAVLAAGRRAHPEMLQLLADCTKEADA